MATLAEIRAKLQAQDDQKSNNFSGDNAIFPHWNIKEGESTKLRFLPDSDESNTFFWIERLLINLTFSGIKGDPMSKPCTIKVPCMEMWEPVGSCPVLAEIRPWFKDPALEDTARKYWKKRSYLMQGFVRENALDEESPENPIRRFIFTPQIFDIVKAALMDPELEEMPTDYTLGLDFTVNKTSGGQYASYATSKYARKESALTQDEMDAIEEHGLYDLSSFLPAKPDARHLEVIKEMFEASVDGEPYDAEKWQEFYKPYGLDSPKTPAATDDKPAADDKDMEDAVKTAEADTQPKVETPDVKVDAPADDAEAPSGNDKAQAILDKIRSRPKA
jgi:hypothetical protein